MTNLKKLSKRGLALFLALVMCLGMLNLTVFAEEAAGTKGLRYTCDLEEHEHTDECYEKTTAPEAPTPDPGDGAEDTGDGTGDPDKSVTDDTNTDPSEEDAKGNETEETPAGNESEEKSEDNKSDEAESEEAPAGNEPDEAESEENSEGNEPAEAESEENPEGNEPDEAESEEKSEDNESAATNVDPEPASVEVEIPDTATPKASAPPEAGKRELTCELVEHTHGKDECSSDNNRRVLVANETELQDAIVAKENVELTGNINVTKTIIINSNFNFTLDLNGYTITYQVEDAPLFQVYNGTFTVKDSGGNGQISSSQKNAYAIVVVFKDGTFKLESGTLTGHENYSGDGTGNGAAIYNKGTVVMSGGTISNCTADGKGGAVCLVSGASMTMTGGTISGCKAGNGDANKGKGGAVFVDENATFTMYGGMIGGDTAEDGNKASAGGGIYADLNSFLNIYGGSVSHNTATGTHSGTDESPTAGNFGGGGMWINGKATIDPNQKGGSNITISCNESATISDLGGGGIYVNNEGTLNLMNADITDNTAKGLGGGIASCVHGRVAILSVNGAAVYSNTAKGEAKVQNNNAKDAASVGYSKDLTVGEYVDGSPCWTDGFKKAAVDVFSAGNANTPEGETKGGVIVSNIRPDGAYANWTGQVMEKINGEFKDVTVKGNDAVYGSFLLGLKAGNTNTPVFSMRKVTITGNTSQTHGGGIACNGIMNLGTEGEMFNVNDVKLTVKKDLIGDSLKNGEFTFELVNENQKVVATATNDANGTATLSIPASQLGSAGTHTFTVREKSGNDVSVKYDDAEYTVKVNVAKSSEVTKKVGDADYTITTYTTETPVITKDDKPVESIDFKNSLNYGKLSISKKLEQYDETDKDTEWEFTVQFTGRVLKSYSYTVNEGESQTLNITDGRGTISLKAGQTATITDIPSGTAYTVTEKGGDYYTTSVGEEATSEATGTIEEDKTSTAEFTNKIIRGKLSIVKTVTLDDGYRYTHEDETYDFAVYSGEIKDLSVNSTPIRVLNVHIDKDGAEGETLDDLRYGTYTIVEIDPNGLENYEWKHVTYGEDKAEGQEVEVTIDGKTVTGYAYEVDVHENDVTVEVTADNCYTRKTGDLRINKTVSGNRGDQDAEWTFTVTLTSPEDFVQLAEKYTIIAPVDVTETKTVVDEETGVETTVTTTERQQDAEGTLSFTEQADGTYVSAPITLKHGETAVISGIPAGTTYTVTEEEANQDGYSTSATGAEGTIAADVPADAQFTNYKNSSSSTSSDISVTVNKVWSGDDEDSRPGSVTVQLYNGGRLYNTVVLSENNSWTYTWTRLASNGDWSVREADVPDGYTSQVTQSGNTFTVTNTFEETEVEEPDVPLTDIPDEPNQDAEVPEMPEEVEVPDEDVPLADIPDEEIPLSDVPKTGNSAGLWGAMTLLSAIGLLGLSLLGRKKDKEN